MLVNSVNYERNKISLGVKNSEIKRTNYANNGGVLYLGERLQNVNSALMQRDIIN
jgi:hypothetical protein